MPLLRNGESGAGDAAPLAKVALSKPTDTEIHENLQARQARRLVARFALPFSTARAVAELVSVIEDLAG